MRDPDTKAAAEAAFALAMALRYAATDLIETAGALRERWLEDRPARPQHLEAVRKALADAGDALAAFDRGIASQGPVRVTVKAGSIVRGTRYYIDTDLDVSPNYAAEMVAHGVAAYCHADAAASLALAEWADRQMEDADWDLLAADAFDAEAPLRFRDGSGDA